MANLKITLVKSLNGRLEKHIATAESLGLRKIGQTTIQPDNTQTRGKIRIGFEGGQMPLARRVPKRGFNNIFAKPLTAVNISELEVFENGAVVDAAALLERGIVSDCKYGLKILARGELTKKLTVKAAAFSESAKAKIEQAGGKAEVV